MATGVRVKRGVRVGVGVRVGQRVRVGVKVGGEAGVAVTNAEAG